MTRIKSLQQIVEDWRKRNGAATFDLKEKTIILHDGGLFCIEEKKVMLAKSIGYKPLKGGMHEVIFSKEKYPNKVRYATIYMNELQDTINYLLRMKRMLNKAGVKTNMVR